MGSRIRSLEKSSVPKAKNLIVQRPKAAPSRFKSTPADHILNLQKTIGNQAVQRLLNAGVIQAKLKIGQSNDIYEQEADRVAEEVMSMPEPTVRREPFEEEEQEIQSKSIESLPPIIQRQAEEEEDEYPRARPIERQEMEEEELQTKESAHGSFRVIPNVELRINAMRGGGQPLSDHVRAFFEPRFNRDFSQVRVHTDTRAADASRALNAQAFTHKKDVFFGSGRYAPQTSEGKRLLVHELTHVMQASRTRRLYRKIEVNKRPWHWKKIPKPLKKIPKRLRKRYRGFGVELLKKMHNDKLIFQFDTMDELRTEAKKRIMAVEGLDKAHRGCCIVGNNNFYLDSSYWIKQSETHPLFRVNAEVLRRRNKTPADAVEAIFKDDAKTVLECASMSVAIQYYALLKALKRDEFNRRFPGGKGIVIRHIRVIVEESEKPEIEQVHPVSGAVKIGGVKDLL